MDIIYIILNIVQGVGEFLPISSSGHIIIIEHLARIQTGYLETFLHVPSTIAIGIYFFKDLLHVAKERKTWLLILAGILPAGIIGFLLNDILDLILYSPLVVGISQLFWGVAMVYLVYITKRKGSSTTTSSKEAPATAHITLKQAFIIGCAQVLALIPGTSRSGITTMAGIATSLPPSQSARFSFIIGFPLLFAASALGLYKAIQTSVLMTIDISPITLIVGFILSMVVSIVSIKLFTSKSTLKVMHFSGIYRILLGIIILAWLI